MFGIHELFSVSLGKTEAEYRRNVIHVIAARCAFTGFLSPNLFLSLFFNSRNCSINSVITKKEAEIAYRLRDIPLISTQEEEPLLAKLKKSTG